VELGAGQAAETQHDLADQHPACISALELALHVARELIRRIGTGDARSSGAVVRVVLDEQPG
jgi:hypothetical protein